MARTKKTCQKKKKSIYKVPSHVNEVDQYAGKTTEVPTVTEVPVAVICQSSCHVAAPCVEVDKCETCQKNICSVCKPQHDMMSPSHKLCSLCGAGYAAPHLCGTMVCVLCLSEHSKTCKSFQTFALEKEVIEISEDEEDGETLKTKIIQETYLGSKFNAIVIDE